jgi:hypothetical protein
MCLDVGLGHVGLRPRLCLAAAGQPSIRDCMPAHAPGMQASAWCCWARHGAGSSAVAAQQSSTPQAPPRPLRCTHRPHVCAVKCCLQVIHITWPIAGGQSAYLISTAHVPHVPRPRQLMSCARPLWGDALLTSMAVRSLSPRLAVSVMPRYLIVTASSCGGGGLA